MTVVEQDNGALADLGDSAKAFVMQQIAQQAAKPPDELLRELEHFALRRPMLFLGGALVAGIGAARFIKSSTPQGDEAAAAQRKTSGRIQPKRNHGEEDTQAAER